VEPKLVFGGKKTNFRGTKTGFVGDCQRLQGTTSGKLGYHSGYKEMGRRKY
jgi:hypothetical protein